MAHDKEKERIRKQKYYQDNKKEIQIRQKEYYKNNKKEIRQKAQEYDKEHAEEITVRKRNYHKNNQEKQNKNSRKNHLLREYGITIDEYDKLYLKQDGKCAICKKWFSRLWVDHNHETKKIRGLLCHNCNVTLGLVYESTDTLFTMIKYLKNQ